MQRSPLAPGERPFVFFARMHATWLEPWTGPGAWWRSPSGELWASVLIAAPFALLMFLIDWLEWMVQGRRRP